MASPSPYLFANIFRNPFINIQTAAKKISDVRYVYKRHIILHLEAEEKKDENNLCEYA